MSRSIAIGFAALLVPTGVFGQASPLDEQEVFQRFLLQPGIQNDFQAMVLAREPAPMLAECADLKVLEAAEYNIVQRPKFEVRGGLQLVSGAWVHIFTVDRCGTKTRRRLLIKYDPKTNRLDPIALLPGDFHGDLQLEVDTNKIVMPGLMASTRCNDPKTLFVWDVRSLGPRVDGNWSEIWKAQACGNVVYYRIDYSQGSRATDIKARLYTPPTSDPLK